MKFIVKRTQICSGASCLVCQEYIDGFITRDGGIALTDNRDVAELVRLFCPSQIISIQEVGSPSRHDRATCSRLLVS